MFLKIHQIKLEYILISYFFLVRKVYEPDGGLDSPQYHPRALEVLLVLQGILFYVLVLSYQTQITVSSQRFYN